MSALPKELADSQVFLETVRVAQSTRRYHELLHGPWDNVRGVVYRRERSASGLAAAAFRQDAMSSVQRQQLAEFRLHQFLLWGWYDADIVRERGITADPAFLDLPPATIHVIGGTSTGRVLAYFAIVPADYEERADEIRERPHTERGGREHLLGSHERPLFPAEYESFGPEVFASLPALRTMSITKARELTCMLRNQAITSPLSTMALVEAVYTTCQILMLPELEIQVALGCGDYEMRRMLAGLGMPILYAPLAEVTRNGLTYYWANGMNDQGKFWPFVVATQDLRAQDALFADLNSALSLPPHAVRRALVLFRRRGGRALPWTVMPEPEASAVLWSADPFFGMDTRSQGGLRREEELVDVAQRDAGRTHA